MNDVLNIFSGAATSAADAPRLQGKARARTGKRAGAAGGRFICAALWLIFAGICSGAPTTPLAGVAFEQHIGAQLPVKAELRDEEGRHVRFGELLSNKPAVLIFGYSRCPQLCSVVANAAVEALRALRPTAGRDFSVLYVSIDPTDTPRDLAAMKRRDTRRFGRSGSEAGWHYLCGEESDLRGLTDAAGFRFAYDPRQRLYAHASGFLVLTADGRVSQYFLGVDFSAKELAAALERAGEGKTGTSVYQLLLVCARGAMISGKYGRIIWVSLEIAVIATVVALFGGIGRMVWQERRTVGRDLQIPPGPGGTMPAGSGDPALPRPGGEVAT